MHNLCLFLMQLAAFNHVKLGEKGIAENVFDEAIIGKNYNLRKLKSAKGLSTKRDSAKRGTAKPETELCKMRFSAKLHGICGNGINKTGFDETAISMRHESAKLIKFGDRIRRKRNRRKKVIDVAYRRNEIWRTRFGETRFVVRPIPVWPIQDSPKFSFLQILFRRFMSR